MKELNVKDLERAAGGFGPSGCTEYLEFAEMGKHLNSPRKCS